MKSIKAFKINIDLPRHPKGEVFYCEFNTMPSKFNSAETYTNKEWFMISRTWDKKIQIGQVWSWIEGMIETCLTMRDWEETAKALISDVKVSKDFEQELLTSREEHKKGIWK